MTVLFPLLVRPKNATFMWSRDRMSSIPRVLSRRALRGGQSEPCRDNCMKLCDSTSRSRIKLNAWVMLCLARVNLFNGELESRDLESVCAPEDLLGPAIVRDLFSGRAAGESESSPLGGPLAW